jgi:hypothetical protein
LTGFGGLVFSSTGFAGFVGCAFLTGRALTGRSLSACALTGRSLAVPLFAFACTGGVFAEPVTTAGRSLTFACPGGDCTWTGVLFFASLRTTPAPAATPFRAFVFSTSDVGTETRTDPGPPSTRWAAFGSTLAAGSGATATS